MLIFNIICQKKNICIRRNSVVGSPFSLAFVRPSSKPKLVEFFFKFSLENRVLLQKRIHKLAKLYIFSIENRLKPLSNTAIHISHINR